MSPARISLLLAIMALCAGGGIAAAWMLLHEAAHPLATRDACMTWLAFDLPYLLLVGAGLLSLRRVGVLVGIVIITGLTVFMITAACYQDMETSLFIMNARSAGRHGMSCGPPFSFIVLPVAYVLSIAAVGVAAVLLPFQARARGNT